VAPFTIVEATIPEMRVEMEQGRVTSKALVRQSLERIATYEKLLNATIAVNPPAIDEAEARDADRAQKKDPRGAARDPGGAQGQHPHD
jgi:amidase